jgi:single-stranded-DNA-specific exonuclease
MEPGNLSAVKWFFICTRLFDVGSGRRKPCCGSFLTNDPKAIELAQILEFENYERRKIDEVTFSHALELVDKCVNLEEAPAIVLHEDNWHAGVIGIVASRLVEKFNIPAIMLTTIDGVAKGSARRLRFKYLRCFRKM